RGAGGDGRHRPARLGGRGRPHVVRSRPDRPADRPRPPDRARRPRQPHPLRSRPPRPRGLLVLRVEEPQHPLRRDDPPRPGGGDVPARQAHRPRRETGVSGALLVLEDGRVFHGTSYGAEGETFGEIVFNTANTGVNDADPESARVWVAGYVVGEPSRVVSSWRATRSLDDYLKDQGVVGIALRGTRALTRHLRERGAMRAGVFSSPKEPVEALVERVRQTPSMVGADLTAEVATAEPYVVHAVGAKRHTVAAIDLGMKDMTPRRMAERGCEVHVLPATATFADIEAVRPDGVFFSNGP